MTLCTYLLYAFTDIFTVAVSIAGFYAVRHSRSNSVFQFSL